MKVGVLGLGFMGATHVSAFGRLPGVEISSVFSNNEKALSGDLRDVGGNLGFAGSQHNFSQVTKCRSWEDVLADPKLDAIDICLPSHLHAQITIAALTAGKHVLVEKPMALTVEDCNAMQAAAVKHRKILMVGHVLRFWPDYLELRKFVDRHSGEQIREARFSRRCGLPIWSRWLQDESLSGGAMLDLLVHDIDIVLNLFGPPNSVRARTAGGVDTVEAKLQYEAGFSVSLGGGWFEPERPFAMSFDVKTESAHLMLDEKGLRQQDANGEWEPVTAEPQDAYQAEVGYFLECCRKNEQPERCPPASSAKAIALALQLKQSRATGGTQVACAL